MSSTAPHCKTPRIAARPDLRKYRDSLSAQQPEEARGNDGLTEHERLESLGRFRSKVGAKPELTDDHRLKRDEMFEKLRGGSSTSPAA